MDLIISGLIVMAGIGIFFVSKWGGIAVALCGLLSFLVYKSGWKREGDDTPLRHRTVEVSRNCKTSLMEFLEGKNEEPNVRPGNEGGTLLLEMWYASDLSKSYVQLSEYMELRFQEITEIVELNESATQNLLSKL